MNVAALAASLPVLCSPTLSQANGQAPAKTFAVSSALAAQVPLALSTCGLAFASTPQMSARPLDTRRIEVSWQAGNRIVKVELRFECEPGAFDRLAADAGFFRQANGWVSGVGQQRLPAERVSTETWTGMESEAFQGNVCRSVVGQASGSEAAFFAEFCVAEADYRRAEMTFRSVGRHLVFAN